MDHRLLTYEKPACRVRELDLEAARLTGTGTTEPFPIDPFDPELG